MKIKHNSGTKTEREALALEIILAEEKGELVEPTIVFPPGYLENLREIHKKSSWFFFHAFFPQNKYI